MPAEVPARSDGRDDTAAATAEPVATPQPPARRGPGLDQPIKPGAALALLKEPAAKPRPLTPQEQLEGFAKDLRELRTRAGLGYPEMAELSHYTMKTLASAAGGLNLPTLPVIMAYVRACDGTMPEWEDRWHRLADAMKQAADDAGDEHDARDASDASDAKDSQGGARHSRGAQDDQTGRDSRGGPERRETREPRRGPGAHDPQGGPDRPDLRGGPDGPDLRGGPDGPDLRGGPDGPGERAGRSEPWPSQVASPPSAPSGGPAGGAGPVNEQAPGSSEQVYVITSAAPRRPQRLCHGPEDQPVEVTSLGYRTDLMVRRLEGSEVADHGNHVVVRSPGHPGFWWGNFILLPAPPRPREAAGWLARFAEVFPEASHVALGVDTTEPEAAERSGLPEAGLRLERSTVLVATAIHEPPHVNLAVQYRPLAGDADWQQSLELRLAADDSDGAATQVFYEQRTADARRMAENGHGAWFGAFASGRLTAQLGIFSDGSGIARYQNVETDPDWRRNGLAGTLVWQAGRWALGQLDARTLVIVADPAAAAIRIYRSVGFRDVETQTAFQRPPYAVD
jgi:GNAT superfamily N-acetyltransferase